MLWVLVVTVLFWAVLFVVLGQVWLDRLHSLAHLLARLFAHEHVCFLACCAYSLLIVLGSGLVYLVPPNI